MHQRKKKLAGLRLPMKTGQGTVLPTVTGTAKRTNNIIFSLCLKKKPSAKWLGAKGSLTKEITKISLIICRRTLNKAGLRIVGSVSDLDWIRIQLGQRTRIGSGFNWVSGS
jgi:hypothetical protein